MNKKTRGVSWHKKQNRWRVMVEKLDKTVNPTRLRRFYREFVDLDDAIRVRDFVARLLQGPNAKLNSKEPLPPSITQDDVFTWLLAQNVISQDEVPRYMNKCKPA